MRHPDVTPRSALRRVLATGALATLLSVAAGQGAKPAYPPPNLDGLEGPFHFTQRDGESLYHAICQGCHMPDALGAQGAGHYPALSQNPRVGATAYILHNVVHGRNGMPSFGPALDDAQIAAVVNYVRTHFGNNFTDTVTIDDVRAERASTE